MMFISFVPIAFGEETSQGWEKLPDMPERRSEAGSAVIDKKIYIAGGLNNENKATSSLFVFDTENESLSSVISMTLAIHHAGLTSYGGKMYVAGGYLDGWIPSDTLMIYDPKTDMWSFGSELPTARGALSAKFADGKMYAVG